MEASLLCFPGVQKSVLLLAIVYNSFPEQIKWCWGTAGLVLPMLLLTHPTQKLSSVGCVSAVKQTPDRSFRNEGWNPRAKDLG